MQEETMAPNSGITPSGTRTYTLTIQGESDADFTSAFCPPETRLVGDGKTFRLTCLRLDQSGLIGLLRQLHNYGYFILSLDSE